MNFVKKSAVKEFFRREGLRVGADVYDTINTKLGKFLLRTIERTRKNKRTTVLSHDL
jgi:histone H3/H4